MHEAMVFEVFTPILGNKLAIANGIRYEISS